MLAAPTALLLPIHAHAQASSSPKPGASHNDDHEARELFRLGKLAFDEGRFERALKYFEDSYELSRRPTLLSNIGAALDRLRRDREALDAYRRYLAEVPDAQNREFVEERIRVIENAMQRSVIANDAVPSEAAPASAPSPAETARAEPTHAAPAPAAATEPAADRGSSNLFSSPWFWGGVGVVAVAAVVIGIVVASSGGGTREAPPVRVGAQTRVQTL